MFSITEYAVRTNPDIATAFNQTAMLNARMVLDTGVARALDKRETKRYAWAAIMSMREMYNKLNGWRIANAAGQAWPDTTALASFEDNFTIQQEGA